MGMGCGGGGGRWIETLDLKVERRAEMSRQEEEMGRTSDRRSGEADEEKAAEGLVDECAYPQVATADWRRLRD
jgi:hypothetical protein